MSRSTVIFKVFCLDGWILSGKLQKEITEKMQQKSHEHGFKNMPALSDILSTLFSICKLNVSGFGVICFQLFSGVQNRLFYFLISQTGVF